MLWNGMNHSSYSSLDHFPNLRPRGNCDKASPSPQQKTVPKQHVGPWFLTPDGTFKLGFGAPSANKKADIGLPVSHAGVKIKVQLAQRTENLAKQAAAEDESHPPSQGHRHMGPCWDLLFCSAITQLNYTSLLSCSHDDLDLGTNRDNLLDFCCFGSWTKPRTTAKPEFNDPPRPIGDVHTQMFLDGRKSHVKISAIWRFRGHH